MKSDMSSTVVIKLQADEFQALHPLALRAMSDSPYRHRVFGVLTQMGVNKHPSPDSANAIAAFYHLAMMLAQGHVSATKKMTVGEVTFPKPAVCLLAALILSTKVAEARKMDEFNVGFKAEALIRATESLSSQMSDSLQGWLNFGEKEAVNFIMPSGSNTIN